LIGQILAHQSFEKAAINETSSKLNSGWPFPADSKSLNHTVLNSNASKLANRKPQQHPAQKLIKLNSSYEDPLSTSLVTGIIRQLA